MVAKKLTSEVSWIDLGILLAVVASNGFTGWKADRGEYKDARDNNCLLFPVALELEEETDTFVVDATSSSIGLLLFIAVK